MKLTQIQDLDSRSVHLQTTRYGSKGREFICCCFGFGSTDERQRRDQQLQGSLRRQVERYLREFRPELQRNSIINFRPLHSPLIASPRGTHIRVLFPTEGNPTKPTLATPVLATSKPNPGPDPPEDLGSINSLRSLASLAVCEQQGNVPRISRMPIEVRYILKHYEPLSCPK
jgi:hypothetical protein